MNTPVKRLLTVLFITCLPAAVAAEYQQMVFKAGHPSLQHWRLSSQPDSPSSNPTTQAKAALGKVLFFDPRLSAKGNMSCATCHNPALGWSDGLDTAIGHDGQKLERATPTIINTGYNHIQMWDGRAKTLEEQALGPMKAKVEMNSDFKRVMAMLKGTSEYVSMFDNAFPKDGITEQNIAKAIAAYERTVVSTNSPFDQWLAGNPNALTDQQINGFKLFINPQKGNCAVCHSAPNFTDDGFHNLGLASNLSQDPDHGRFSQRPLTLMKGAFKTPTVRDISLTAPYFHDGSAKTLNDVILHYISGGKDKRNLSPNFTPARLTQQEVEDMVAFMIALTTPPTAVTIPDLPKSH